MANSTTDHSRMLRRKNAANRLTKAGQERRRLNVIITSAARDALDALVLVHGDRTAAVNAALLDAGKKVSAGDC